jgi:hypothetical protein
MIFCTVATGRHNVDASRPFGGDMKTALAQNLFVDGTSQFRAISITTFGGIVGVPRESSIRPTA